MSTREVNIIEINIKEDEMQKIFKIKAMNVFENYLFGINDANTALRLIIIFSINLEKLLLLYKKIIFNITSGYKNFL